MILHILGLTPDCIDEIANNAINTDASPQIDIILEGATKKIELKRESNKIFNPIAIIKANIGEREQVKLNISVGE
ncbi:unnamed protein product [Arctia plantaginis]|uniref:Uncharacterized protein n=1 Tax=Arctia plantaginis TaxID=874455 RepID=A0A8S1AAK1_ARCPL|nr:unnamed protein product [Arctia plantaginis]